MTFSSTVPNGANFLPPGIAHVEGARVEVHSDADTLIELKGGKGLLQFAGVIGDKLSETAIIWAVLALTFIKPLSPGNSGV